MNWHRKLGLAVRALFHKRSLDAQMNEEMQAHIEMQAQENIEAGMSPTEARAAAMREFGGLDSIKEICRDQRGVRWIENILQDLHFGARMLRKNPGFTLAAVATLALGIGANTAIFSAINGVLLKPLPYNKPEELVHLWETTHSGQQTIVSGGVFLDWKEYSASLEDLAQFSGVDKNLIGDGFPDRVSGWQVAPGFLRILRVRPFAGRDFLPQEDGRGEKVAILSHRIWQGRFGGQEVIGRNILLDGERHEVIGVLPPKALLDEKIDFLLPHEIRSGEVDSTRHIQNFNVIGRLKPGISHIHAKAELEAIKQRLNADYPPGREKWGFSVVSMREQVTGKAKPILFILFGAVSLVLLIACGNFANLLLARAAAREKEIAVRAALGAGRRRIICQLLTESVLLSMLGGTLGLVLAFWTAHLLSALGPAELPRAQNIVLDLRTLAFSLTLSVTTGALFGLLPALRISTFDQRQKLKKGGAISTRGSNASVLGALVITEVAFTTVLLLCAGLLLNSFFRLLRVHPGFDPKDTLTVDIRHSAQKYPTPERRALFLEQIIERLEGRQGVVAAGWATTLPMIGWSSTSPVTTDQGDGFLSLNSTCDWVAGNYYRAMGIPVLGGRVFTAQDNSTNAPRRAILNEALAGRLFANKNPLGRNVNFRGENYEIVGIVGNVRQKGLQGDPEPRIYLPQIYAPLSGSLIVRSTATPDMVAKLIRNEMVALDPEQPVSNIRTLQQLVAGSVAERRLALRLIGGFALVALLLALVGLYGVMAYIVTRRTHEIGMRMALGASRRNVLLLIVKKGLSLTGVGLAIGLAGALGSARVLRHLLYGITSTDMPTFIGVAGFLVSIAFVACYIPARRASKIDPMLALRYE